MNEFVNDRSFFSGTETGRLPYYVSIYNIILGFKQTTGFVVFILQRLQCIWMSPIITNYYFFLLFISCYEKYSTHLSRTLKFLCISILICRQYLQIFPFIVKRVLSSFFLACHFWYHGKLIYPQSTVNLLLIIII